MRVLIADGNRAYRELLTALVEEQGWEAHDSDGGTRALALLRDKHFDALVVDLDLPNAAGMEILQRILSMAAGIKVVVIGGALSVADAVRAMKLGAAHCLAKPFRVEELTAVLRQLLPAPRRTDESASAPEEMIAASVQMRRTHALLGTIARSRATTVLITGETGTGKEVVARRLHHLGDRRQKPFAAVNCSAIPASLIESELFGHERGAFTDAKATRKGCFELAGDGTLFLDEVGDLAPESQGKLLRVLQERRFRRVGGTVELPFQARVVAATHMDLATAAQQGRFREDLYYRLAVIPVHLHPLRERIGDILPLAEHFMRQFARELNCDCPELAPDQRRMLQAHSWPGNVRELRNVMERLVLMGGHLEFVAPGRQVNWQPEPALSAPECSQSTPAVEGSERKMLYDVLLQRLLEEDALASVASTTAV